LSSASGVAGVGDPPFEIPVQGTLNALVGISETLDEYSAHEEELLTVPSAWVRAYRSRREIGDNLRERDLHLIYFYCHGGRARGRAWLGVGTRKRPEQIFARYLKHWKVRWVELHPLVFINGCNTVGIRPDDMLDFNRMLAWCEASGVIGTEISIPESLARHVGTRFVHAFRAGQAVGETMRRIRLELLARRNPLGLAYTPYCLAELRVRDT
jgi:hypothetical protein